MLALRPLVSRALTMFTFTVSIRVVMSGRVRCVAVCVLWLRCLWWNSAATGGWWWVVDGAFGLGVCHCSDWRLLFGGCGADDGCVGLCFRYG